MSKDQLSYNNLILVVDDEKDIVQAYIDFLVPSPTATNVRKSSRGSSTAVKAPEVQDSYEILKAHSGKEAVEIAKKLQNEGRQIAGGFFDVKMDGGLDGIQTIQEIWKFDPSMHCTIVTAYQDRSVQDINQLFSDQFGDKVKDQWDYLNKPFTQGEILQKARQMVAAWNRTAQLEFAFNQLKETQDRLVHSERLAAIGQVARGVGHEFGNILQRILGKADVSIKETDLGKIKDSFSTIIQAAERAAVVVRNLQSFSKKSSDKVTVDVAKVITDTLSLTSHEFKTGTLECIDKKQASCFVKANIVELQQVILNLVINAIHATPKGGSIEVGCMIKENKVEIWVADTGTGIAPEVLPRIFEYAFTTKGDKGSGLGLSISKQIVESFNGTIEVNSTVGKGTKFTISLPKVDL